MSAPSIDQELREFLDLQGKARREGKTVEALHEKQDKMMIALRRIAADRLSDKASLIRNSQAIKTLQHQVGLLTDASPQVPTWRPPKEEVTTGTHSVAEIKRQAEELQARLDEEAERKYEEETWWRRQRWLWFGIAVASFFGVTITGCVGYISYRIQALEKNLETRPATTPAK